MFCEPYPIIILYTKGEVVIKSLLLGSKQFPVNVIQGPLAGMSCAPFRLLTWRYSQPAFSCTEMISCKTIIHQPRLAYQRYLKKDPNEGPVCFQLSSSDPMELAEATKIVSDCGADLIDLNCGCPVKKIRNKNAGSKLLTNPVRLYQLIHAMKNNTSLPVSIKIRVQSCSDERFNAEVAQVVSEAGADFLVVHGRHWTEHYETPCNYEEIKFFVEKLKVPVIGNGDIACVDSLKKMFSTGCSGVMLGRAGVGQPWLIRKLIAELRNERFTMPTVKEIGMYFIEHVMHLITLLENEQHALLQARKFAKYYARELKNKIDFSIAINHCNNLEELHKITLSYFAD